MNHELSASGKLAGQSGERVMWPAIGILAAAVVIGVVYNQVSPLGVRKPVTTEEPALVNQSPAIPTAPEVSPSVSQPATTNLPTWDFLPPPSTTVPVGPATPAMSAAEAGFPELKWPAVKALLAEKQIVLVDARLAETYALSRIPGAVSLPAYSPIAELEAFAAKYPRETRFVIYCNSESCDMSHELAAKLARHFGYTNLSLMPGGFAEYVIAESSTGKAP